MSKHCIKEINDEYEMIYSIDINNKKIGIILNILAIILTIIVFAIGLLLISINNSIEFSLDINYLLIGSVSLIIYLILHELVHGVVYKLFTKEKLKFGISLTCAYCGVPNAYVDRVTAMCAVIAPFALFSIGFILPIILCNELNMKMLFLFIFSFHFGGCIGDLYVFILYLFKFKKDIYMKDTGAKQEFYLKKQSSN